MTLEKALKILNLNSDYTDAELKQSYKNLMKKYHPDLYVAKSKEEQSRAENIAKEINEARTIAASNLNRRKQSGFNNNYKNTQTNSTNQTYRNTKKTKANTYKESSEKYYEKLNKLKKSYLQLMRQQSEYIAYVAKEDKLFHKHSEEFLRIINLFCDCINTSTNFEELEQDYQFCIYKMFNDAVFRYVFGWFQSSEIMHWNNYSMIFDENGYNHLKDVRVKMKALIDIVMDSEMAKYQNVPEYEKLKPTISAIKENCTHLCLWGYFSINKSKEKFNKLVDKEIEKYRGRQQQYEHLEEIYSNELIKPLKLIELHLALPNEEKFYEIYNEFNLKTRIKVKINSIFSKKRKK